MTFPFDDPHRRAAPGLWAMDAWTVQDPDFAAAMAERDRLTGPDTVQALPEAAPALAELTDMLARHLATQPGYAVGAAVTRPDGVTVPRDALNRLTAEDWLLLDPAPGHRLIAGALSFPAGWRLGDKLGLPLTGVHGPVPDYGALAPRVDRVMAALHPGRPLQRVNWSVSDGVRHRPVLGQAGSHLRTERQTLRRLPRCRAIVFGIHTRLTPIAALCAEDARGLVRLIDALPPAHAAYKGRARLADARARAARIGGI